MIRSSHGKVRAFRGHRDIDYTDERVVSARAASKLRQRADAMEGFWVVGRFVVLDGVVQLEAVAMTPAYWIDPDEPLTPLVARFARWCTRQAARQWLREHRRPGCRLVNLEQLAEGRRSRCQSDKTPADCQTDNAAGAATSRCLFDNVDPEGVC